MPSLRRLLLLLACLVVGGAIVAPLALVWSALHTEAGMQLVLRHLPHRMGGVTLDIVGVRGTVADGLTVERVEIDHELVHLKFEGISGQVALMPLLLQTIRVQHGTVASARIEVRRRTHPSIPGPPTFMPRWLMIDARDGQVGSAMLSVYNGFRLSVTGITGAAVIRHHVIRFFQGQGLLWGELRVDGIGDLIAADPIGLEVKGRVLWSPAGQPAWMAAGSVRGDLNALNVVAHTEAPFRADVSGQMQDLTNQFHWVGDAIVRNFNLDAWGINSPLGSITGHLAGSGTGLSFSAHGAVNPAGLHAGVFDTRFDGSYGERVLRAKHMEARHLGSGAHAVGSGTIGIDGPRLNLAGEVSDFRWPLTGRDPAITATSGSFTLSGVLPYHVQLKGSGRAAGLEPMPIEAQGTLGKDSFAFDRAELDLFGGHASVAGELTWSPRDTWSVNGRLTNINPRALRSDLPGSVSFTLAASGRGFDPKGDLSASFGALTGKLRGVSASGSGTVAHAGDTWSFGQVRVGLGNAHFALDGHVNARMDLRFDVAATDLGLLAPGMRGQLKAAGSVRGTLADPQLVLTAHGGDFDYQGVKLESLDADVNFDPGAFDRPSKIEARLRKLSYRARTLENVTLSLKGPPSAYELGFGIAATGLTASAKARGAYAHGVFDGELEGLAINGSEALHLALERPVGLLLSPAHARVEWLCLVGEPGSMCADGDWTPKLWSTTVMSNQLPLHTLTAGMTPSVEYLGTASVLARLAGGEDTALVGTVRAELADAEIAHKLASRRVEHTRIGSGTVTVNATPDAVTAQVDLGEGEVGTLHGRLEARRVTDEWQDMPVNGEFHAQTAELGLISLYVPDIDRASGHFNADVHLAGTAAIPSFAGEIKVSDGEIDVYQVNLALRQVQLDARVSDQGLNFEGGAQVGNGEVKAAGHLEWHELLPYGKFHLKGSNLRVADVPEAHIEASPDLDFDVEGRKIEVSGKVEVPYAKIQPKDFTGAVRASPDEVVVGSGEDDPTKRIEVMSNITLSVGERVSIDSSGLTGKLGGAITIRSGYDAITRATGELSVSDGKYTAYGRKLDIERGRLIFTGGPIDDPGIDLRAIKEFPDVKAGVNVRGTLLAPRMTFFSDPPLPQSQIVSLILAGGSLESAQNRTTGNSGAGNAALAQGAAIIGQQIGGRVGIEDVSLESDITNETSLVLGRYLSPRLYVSYGISLTQQLNTLKLRYTLGDHWTVKTEVGQARGADLVYAIDK